MVIKNTLICLGLVTGSILTLGIQPAKAAVLSFGTEGIQFDSDTVADFFFERSRGLYQSTFGVYDLAADTFTPLFQENKPYDTTRDDYLGTCGNLDSAVPNCNASFTFAKGVEYAFALQSINQPTVYSTTRLNDTPDGLTTQARFSSNNPFTELVLISFEDQFRNKDLIDFNDFLVSANARQNPEDIPEPTALIGLGLVGGWMWATRRKGKGKGKYVNSNS